ncbi:MAG: hypothetical protein ACYTKD_07425 [Planctomycetota bacterium]
MRERLKAAQAASQAYRLRSLVGKVVNLRDEGNVYGEKVSGERLDELMDEFVDVEFVRHMILEGAREGAVSVKDLAERIGVAPEAVLREIVVLRRKNLLELDKIDGRTPLYRTA